MMRTMKHMFISLFEFFEVQKIKQIKNTLSITTIMKCRSDDSYQLLTPVCEACNINDLLKSQTW